MKTVKVWSITLSNSCMANLRDWNFKSLGRTSNLPYFDWRLIFIHDWFYKFIWSIWSLWGGGWSLSQLVSFSFFSIKDSLKKEKHKICQEIPIFRLFLSLFLSWKYKFWQPGKLVFQKLKVDQNIQKLNFCLSNYSICPDSNLNSALSLYANHRQRWIHLIC